MYYKYSMVKYTKKTITIRTDQSKWIKDKMISLSRFVQKAIDKAMKK